MLARPYLLVSDGALRHIQARATEQLCRWAHDWGIDRQLIEIDASRFADLEPGQETRFACAGHGAWVDIPEDLEAHVYELLCGCPGRGQGVDADSIAFGCAAQASASMRRALRALLIADGQAPQELAVAARPHAGYGLACVSVRIATARLRLVSSGYRLLPAQPAGEELGRLESADLDGALKAVRTQCVAELGASEVPLVDLLQLKPGDVVVLDRTLDQPLLLRTADGTTLLEVHLGRRSDRYAVQVLGPATS